MSKFWKKIEQPLDSFPFLIEEDDDCYFAREYIKRAGFKGSEVNQLISNFKKSVEYLNLTLEKLLSFIILPPKDEKILIKKMIEELGMSSKKDLLSNYL